MTTIACRQCGKAFEPPTRGPRPLYCSDRCRQSAHRGTAPGAARHADAPMPTPVTSTPSRAIWRERDFGDGDPCPQDASHGHLYFMKPGTRQWCPSSRHEGNPFYARDGLTPAPRAASDFVPPSTGGDVEQSPALREAPDSSSRGVSLPTPAAASQQPTITSRYLEAAPAPGNDLQLGLPLVPAI